MQNFGAQFVIYNALYFLPGSSPEKTLKWCDRLLLLISIAKAVHFLHTGIIPGSLYNRLKTSSILLDEHLVSKLSDYGLSIITDKIYRQEVGLSYRMNVAPCSHLFIKF
jgi:hypothetical protein